MSSSDNQLVDVWVLPWESVSVSLTAHDDRTFGTPTRERSQGLRLAQI
jgi:hypothetical protein